MILSKVARCIDRCCAVFLMKLNLTESPSCVLPLILIKIILETFERSQMSAFLVDGKKMITDKGGYVTCGQTILRHLVPPWQGSDLMIISAPESPTVLKKYLRSVLKIHQVC